jgi:hypothetical protein
MQAALALAIKRPGRGAYHRRFMPWLKMDGTVSSLVCMSLLHARGQIYFFASETIARHS